MAYAVVDYGKHRVEKLNSEEIMSQHYSQATVIGSSRFPFVLDLSYKTSNIAYV